MVSFTLFKQSFKLSLKSYFIDIQSLQYFVLLKFSKLTCGCLGDDSTAGGCCLPGPPVSGTGGTACQTCHLGLGCSQGVTVGLQLGGLQEKVLIIINLIFFHNE